MNNHERQDYMTITKITVWVGTLVLLAVATGCNNSRYGPAYDQKQPQIRSVAILPAKVEMYALHSGGIEERRPDLDDHVRDRVVKTIQEVLDKRGATSISLPPPLEEDESANIPVGQQLALLHAVAEGVVVHHYAYGKERIIEYATGDAVGVLGADDCDAVLCVIVRGVVPTEGRKFLKGAAVVVGAITGIRFHVKTNEAVIMLLLVDRKTGEVLWFNFEHDEKHIAGEHRVRSFVKDACAYLLKPRK